MRFLAAFVAVGATLAFLRRSRQIREHEDYVGTPAVRLEEGERGSNVGKFPQTKHLVVMCVFLSSVKKNCYTSSDIIEHHLKIFVAPNKQISRRS